MAPRPDVIDALNNWDLQSLQFADDATAEERAAAAQLRLIARANAYQVIRAKIVDHLTGCGLDAQGVAAITDRLNINLERVQHPEVVKLLDEAPSAVTVEEMARRFGTDWPTLLANEAGVPVAAVREIYGQIPPR